MIKTIMLFVFTFCTALILKAQVIISPTSHSTIKKIDKKIEVVSNMPNSYLLGYIPSNNATDRKYLKPSDEINLWLRRFVYQQFDTSNDAKAKKLLWIIQDLSVGKDSTQKDAYSFVKLKADIYDNLKKDEAYELVNTFDSTWVVKNTNVDFAQMISTAFDDLYKHSTELKKSKANKRFDH